MRYTLEVEAVQVVDQYGHTDENPEWVSNARANTGKGAKIRIDTGEDDEGPVGGAYLLNEEWEEYALEAGDWLVHWPGTDYISVCTNEAWKTLNAKPVGAAE